MKTVEVCLTPELIHQHDLQGKIAVVVDIFRATSCMVSGLASGVRAIYPVLTVGDCLENGKRGMITAGERGGQKLDSFDIGNSPFEYMQKEFHGKRISVTTTNGTVAINKSNQAREVLIGAFLNLNATIQYLLRQEHSIVIHCAGWKGTPNVEDTLYAGALIYHLGETYQIANDSGLMALNMYEKNAGNMMAAVQNSSHAIRLQKLGIIKDTAFCMSVDEFNIVVRHEEDHLVKI
jgi:2-phosphosulfolactate phosphatase